MIKFRPHKFRFIRFKDGYYDQDKNWVEGESLHSEFIPCRYEVNSRATEIALPNGDGTRYRYSYIIYANLMNIDLKYGTIIELYDNRNNKVATGQVQGFQVDQLKIRIWM